MHCVIYTIKFSDLQMPLTIVAQDVSTRSLITFGTYKTPDIGVAKAVTASMAIPLVFCPVKINESLLIDGGTASAFPAWATDDFQQGPDPFRLVLGFRLGSTDKANCEGLGNYLSAVFDAVAFGDDTLETRHVNGLHDIRLLTNIPVWKFNLTDEEKAGLLERGYRCASDHLLKLNRPPSEEAVRRYLRVTMTQMKRCHPILESAHLRANVALPLGNGTLRICCAEGFESSDCDDISEFNYGEGATGTCWNARQPQVCDLEDAMKTFETKWKMNKYQQCLVRGTLKSLLSIPIVSQQDWDDSNECVKQDKELLGVLNFDSDEDLTTVFQIPEVRLQAVECMFLVANAFQNRI